MQTPRRPCHFVARGPSFPWSRSRHSRRRTRSRHSGRRQGHWRRLRHRPAHF